MIRRFLLLLLLLLLPAPASLFAACWDFEGLVPGTPLRSGILSGWSQAGNDDGRGIVISGPGYHSAGALGLDRDGAHARLDGMQALWTFNQGSVEISLHLRVIGKIAAINVLAYQHDNAGAIVTLTPDAVILGHGGTGVFTTISTRLPVAATPGHWYRLRLILPSDGRRAMIHLGESDHPERILLDGVDTALCGRLPVTRIHRVEFRRFGGSSGTDRFEFDSLSITPAGTDTP